MKLEKAIRILKTETEHTENRIAMELDIQAIETVLQALRNNENKISKCLETINKLKTGEYTKDSKHYYSSLCCNARLVLYKNYWKENKMKLEKSVEYYKNLDNLEEVPIDILRLMYIDLLQNSIPKQKIEDKIKELKENISYLSKFKDWKEKDYTNEDIIENIIQTLQELLESEE